MGGIDGWGIGGPPDDFLIISDLRTKIALLEKEIKSLKRKLKFAQKKIENYKLGECKDWK